MMTNRCWRYSVARIYIRRGVATPTDRPRIMRARGRTRACRCPNRECWWNGCDRYWGCSGRWNWSWWSVRTEDQFLAGFAFATPKRSSNRSKNYIVKFNKTMYLIQNLTCEIISPRAVRTWYKYRYFRWRASSRVSRGLELDRDRAPGPPAAPGWRRLNLRWWSTRQAVMNVCTKTHSRAATGQAHNKTPPQQGGGEGSGLIFTI